MKTLKVYGTRQKMEWLLYIPVGMSRVAVHFQGGSLSSYGTTPAEFHTDNEVLQAIIEDSDYFKSGAIYLIRATPLEPIQEPEAPVENKPLEDKHFACLDDAKQWISDEFGIAQYKVRSLALAEAAAAQKGYNLIIDN